MLRLGNDLGRRTKKNPEITHQAKYEFHVEQSASRVELAKIERLVDKDAVEAGLSPEDAISLRGSEGSTKAEWSKRSDKPAFKAWTAQRLKAAIRRREATILRMQMEGTPVPADLQATLMRLLSMQVEDPKDKTSLLVRIHDLQRKDGANREMAMSELPKQALLLVAELEAKGITPYHPNME